MPDIFTTNEHEWLNRRYTTVAGIACLILLGLLAACGGGNTDPVATTAPTAATSTASEGKVTILAVPPGWGGRVPGSEVINGITVPPEPAPSVNNATIAGVDLNGNGVRDDVERQLAFSVISPADFAKSITYAKLYQGLITSPLPTSRPAALQALSNVNCASLSVSQAVRKRKVKALLANTVARVAAFDNFFDVIVGFSPEELQSCGA